MLILNASVFALTTSTSSLKCNTSLVSVSTLSYLGSSLAYNKSSNQAQTYSYEQGSNYTNQNDTNGSTMTLMGKSKSEEASEAGGKK